MKPINKIFSIKLTGFPFRAKVHVAASDALFSFNSRLFGHNTVNRGCKTCPENELFLSNKFSGAIMNLEDNFEAKGFNNVSTVIVQ